jgi:hypothetical protein
MLICAEPTALYFYDIFNQRIKIRCYNMNRGCASACLFRCVFLSLQKLFVLCSDLNCENYQPFSLNYTNYINQRSGGKGREKSVNDEKNDLSHTATPALPQQPAPSAGWLLIRIHGMRMVT